MAEDPQRAVGGPSEGRYKQGPAGEPQTISVSETNKIQGVPRSCGDCSACCEGWLKVRVLGHDIGLGHPCPYSSGHNCTIHATRPHDPCRVFFCGWAEAGSDLPEWMQPNQSGVIILTGRSTWRGRPLDVVVSAGRDPDEKILSWLQGRSIKTMQPFVYQREEQWYGFGPAAFQAEIAAKAARGEPLWT
ncbi:MAG: hypothetical protein ABIR48_03890 [Gammaproteobacteria bacterium]